MLTAISVILRICSNSVANLFQKKAAETDSPINANLWAYFYMSLFCAIPALYVDWTQFTVEFWINVIIAGFLCTVGTISLIKALQIGELSVLAPINSYKSIIGLVGAFFLLGEIPSVKDLICIFFIFIGSYFVLDTEKEKFSIKTFFRKDIRLRIFALLCSGIEASFLKNIILMSDFKICLILWCFSGFLCSLFIAVIFNKKIYQKAQFVTNSVKYYLPIGVSLLIMQLTTNYVFSKIEVGTALALFQLSSLVSLYFGYKYYKEKDICKKLFGTIIMIISAVLILL